VTTCLGRVEALCSLDRDFLEFTDLTD
jgi:hypothetical protein